MPLELAQIVVRMNRRRGYCDLAHLRSQRKDRGAVETRWAIIAEARKRGFSYPLIGRALNRDHTSIMYAAQQMGIR